MSGESLVIALLTASLLRPFALAAVAWVTLRLFRVRHPASRHAVWTAVLIGMVLLPFVSVLTPHWKVAVLPAPQTAARAALAQAAEFADPGPDVSVAYVTPRVPFQWPSVQTLVIWCYFAGLLAMAGYRVAGLVLLQRVIAGSRPLRARFLLESADVLTPVAVGVLRPAVILPAGWRL